MHAMMKTLVSFPSMYKLVILCAILSLVVANVMEDEEEHHHIRRGLEGPQGDDVEECIPLLRVSESEDSDDDDEEEWDCQPVSTTLAGGIIGPILKLEGLENLPADIAKDFVNEGAAISGNSVLSVAGATKTARSLRIPTASAAQLRTKGVKGFKGSKGLKENNGLGPMQITSDNFLSFPSETQQEDNIFDAGGRRRLEVTGERKILVVRINTVGFLESEPAVGVDQLSDTVFGTGGDNVTVVSQFDDCSIGQLTFLPVNITENSAVGVLEVEVNTTDQDDIAIRELVTDKINKELNNSLPHYPDSSNGFLNESAAFDHVLYCMPPNTTLISIAYTWINGWLSVYKDIGDSTKSWCTSLTVTLHEIGHNIGLAHSGEDSNQYGDNSGVMGSSYIDDDSPRMCYNAAKSYQLGWFSTKTLTLSPNPSGTFSWTGKIFGFVDYEDNNANVVLIKIETFTKVDYYMNFNLQRGFNNGTAEGGNKVLITETGEDGVANSKSWLLAKLSQSESTDLVDSYGSYSWMYHIVVNEIDTSASPPFANVSISGHWTHEDVLLNVGGEQYEESAERTWYPDDIYYLYGKSSSTTQSINGTEADAIYQSDRYDEPNGNDGGDLSFTVPLLAGYYDIVLHFCEWYSFVFKTGGRVFDVKFDGVVVFENVDIWDEAGGEYTALTKTETNYQVSNGAIEISFNAIANKNYPKINAIEIISLATSQPSAGPSDVPSSSPTDSFSPSASPQPSLQPSDSMLPSSVPTIVESEFFVNCGERTASYTDSSENVWEPDESGSQPLYRDTLYTIGTTTADIDGTEDDTIFKSDRWINGNQLWTFPAAPDNYEVTLYFAEIYSPFDVAGKRNFTVLIEGTQVLYQYDIVADVGQYNASIKTFPVTVADNDLTIELIKVKQNPKINGIAVRRLPSASPSEVPSKQPSQGPSRSSSPSEVPSKQPSQGPSRSLSPSGSPSLEPSMLPSREPSLVPSGSPSSEPSSLPSLLPSSLPSLDPSGIPSNSPSLDPSGSPSNLPSLDPSGIPSSLPSLDPSSRPSSLPNLDPSGSPSDVPSLVPSSMPSDSLSPSEYPSSEPSISLKPSDVPSSEPSESMKPSEQESSQPTGSSSPSGLPSSIPSLDPSGNPSSMPSMTPSREPSSGPSLEPSALPSANPTAKASDSPSALPSGSPSLLPSDIPSTNPSDAPSDNPSILPSSKPSLGPTGSPTSSCSSCDCLLTRDVCAKASFAACEWKKNACQVQKGGMMMRRRDRGRAR